jgi:hypothetical protein
MSIERVARMTGTDESWWKSRVRRGEIRAIALGRQVRGSASRMSRKGNAEAEGVEDELMTTRNSPDPGQSDPRSQRWTVVERRI